jgi:hypothetical protein
MWMVRNVLLVFGKTWQRDIAYFSRLLPFVVFSREKTSNPVHLGVES